jgi:hypothetical protein
MAVLAFLGCLLLVLPFGWMVGVMAAIVLSAGAVGQLPMITIPIALLGSLVFAVVPILPVGTRLLVMSVGSVALWLAATAAMHLAGHL